MTRRIENTFETSIFVGDTDVDLRITYSAYYEPARGMGGPWEDSSPAEGELEILKYEVTNSPEGVTEAEIDEAV